MIIIFLARNDSQGEKKMRINRINIFITTFVTIALLLAFMIHPFENANAKLKDGTYSVTYTVKKPDDNSVSIANDYFKKPATLTVKNGKMKVKIQVKNSSWIKTLKTKEGKTYKNTTVVSKNKKLNTRYVQFNATSISKPIFSKMEIDIADMNYKHEYTVRFVFDSKSVKKIKTSK